MILKYEFNYKKEQNFLYVPKGHVWIYSFATEVCRERVRCCSGKHWHPRQGQELSGLSRRGGEHRYEECQGQDAYV